jgi:hypothetical protein
MTDEEGPNAKRPEDRDEDEGDDPWMTESADLPAHKEIASLVSTRSDHSNIDAEDPAKNGQFGLHSAPVGYNTIIGHLAHEHHMSFTNVTVHAAELGMNRLDDEDWIIALRHVHERVSDDAMERGDLRAMARLDRVTKFDFVHSQAVNTTLTVSARTKARIKQLAAVSAIPGYCLAVISVFVGILALKNTRRYRTHLEEEVAAFHQHVLERIDDLRPREPRLSD